MSDYPPQGTGSPPLSPATTVTDETVYGVAPAVGAATTYAREDHTHGSPVAPSIPAAAGAVTSETAYDQAANAGAAATYSRGDHTHGTPAKEIKNKGRAWIAHGDGVITLATAQTDTNYLSQATIHLPAMGGVTTRGPTHTNPMTITTVPGTVSRMLVRLHGGYGYTSCGYNLGYTATNGTTQRFDDVANTQTARTAATPRGVPVGYSLNGFGFTSCGINDFPGNVHVGQTERLDDISNAWTARAAATARGGLAGYSLNGFGFTSCGVLNGGADNGATERFDDAINTHTARSNATARSFLAGYSLNGYGFTSGDNGYVGITERFDDTANTHTARSNLNTPREGLAAFSLGGFGFTSCGRDGSVPPPLATTERFDDVTNVHTARTNAITARWSVAGYSLNGYGFISCGELGGYGAGTLSGAVERFDDTANVWAARTAATARQLTAGFATNEYFVNYITEDA